MRTGAKLYASTVIAVGAVVLALSMVQGLPHATPGFGILLAFAIVASLVKLRLPGIDGTYSLAFFVILTGLCYFTLGQTLVVVCVSALGGTLFSREQRPTLFQVLFNMANLVLSVGACSLLVRLLQSRGLEPWHPAALAAIAFLYFVVNTGIVSGVLSLLDGTPVFRVCREWYFWSFPYYVVGIIVVGLLPFGGRAVPAIGWLAVLPPLYLLHFFCGIAKERQAQDTTEHDAAGLALPKAALAYVGTVTVAAGLLLSWSLLHWQTDGWLKPLIFVAVAIVTSFLKIPLPGVTGTVSLSFVVHLVALSELALPELLILAGVSAAVQSIWGSGYRPAPIQVLFNVTVLLLSAGASYGAFELCRTALGQPLLVSLLVGATCLYFVDTLLVAAILCLAEAKPLSEMWQGCYYWSFPYYLVGAAFAAVMSSVGVSDGWAISFLALPLMALIYLTYRLQLGAVVARSTDA